MFSSFSQKRTRKNEYHENFLVVSDLHGYGLRANHRGVNARSQIPGSMARRGVEFLLFLCLDFATHTRIESLHAREYHTGLWKDFHLKEYTEVSLKGLS